MPPPGARSLPLDVLVLQRMSGVPWFSLRVKRRRSLADRLSGWTAPYSLKLRGRMNGARIISMSAQQRLIRILVILAFISLILDLFVDTSTHAQAGAGKDWSTYGGGPESSRYSNLKKINRRNVGNLKVAWTFDSGDAYPGSEMQCNPLVVNGVLYATTPKVNVIALNATTGKLLWRFDPHEGRKVLGKMRNRGVTYWSDGKQGRIFIAVRQYLYSLDAKNGKPVAAFGSSGRVDLRESLRPGEKEMVSIST